MDTVAPDTTITGNPPNPTLNTSATFTFTSNEAGATFQCSLDGAAFTSCTSGQTYTALALGSHTFQVRAVDPAGNVDPTPASYTWNVLSPTCTPTLTFTESRFGALNSFESITAGVGTVTVDSQNVGSGLRSYTLVSATNAVVNIPAFTLGTVNPVTATFTVPDINQPVDFTLRASHQATNVLIRAQCSGGGGPTPTPTPTPTPVPPTPTPTPTPAPGVCTPTLTITEPRPGGAAQFSSIAAGSGTVTVDTINTGFGLQSYSLVSATNAVVNIPLFPPGTFNPVTATFTIPDPAMPVDFTLRASSGLSVLIRARCGGASANAETFLGISAPDVSFWLPESGGSRVLWKFEKDANEVFLTTSE